MYGKDFWARVNFQSLCAYLIHGSELAETERGTLEERYRRKMQAFHDAVRRLCHDEDDEWAAEDIYFESGEMEGISFEAGFLAGLRLGLAAGENGTPKI